MDYDTYFHLKEFCVELLGIYLLPTDVSTIYKRLLARGAKRGITNEKVFKEKLKHSLDSIAHCGAYDYLIENTEDKYTADKIHSIVEEHKIKSEKFSLLKKWSKV